MKIMNREMFLKQPPGIVYSKYFSLGMFEGLFEKGETKHNDWRYQDLIGDVQVPDGGEFVDILFEAENGSPFEMELECGRRDGMFEESDMFAVYDKKDIEKLFVRLAQIVSSY